MANLETIESIQFLLNDLPFPRVPDVGYANPSEVEPDPNHPHYIHYLALTYMPLLQRIAASTLNGPPSLGAVLPTIVNFGAKGFVEVTQSRLPNTMAEFKQGLGLLFEEGGGSCPWAEKFKCNLEDILSCTRGFNNYRVIACQDGVQLAAGQFLRPYLARLERSMNFLLVIGEFNFADRHVMHVRVSHGAMPPAECLGRVLLAMENRLV